MPKMRTISGSDVVNLKDGKESGNFEKISHIIRKKQTSNIIKNAVESPEDF